MIIKQNSGNEKILVALIESTKSLTVKLLAEKTGIAYKNIHRNLTKLSDNGFIHKDIVQDGRNRYTYISLTPKGSNYKSEATIVISNEKATVSNASEYDNTHLVKEIQPDTIRLGIGFYRDYARGLGIPNYSTLRLPMLKLKIGITLIKQSGLVDTMTKINKYFDEVIQE